MSRGSVPPLDVHAHVSPTIAAHELLGLRAAVLVATRSQEEYRAAMKRRDPLAIWGVGVHPGVSDAVRDFDSDELRSQLRLCPLLSEVGLDRRSHVPLEDQRRVFGAALDVHDESDCIASVHSAGRTREVIEVLQGHRCSTVVLHWWRGSAAETREAIALGCYFSVNPRCVSGESTRSLIPEDRILTETDHPFGDRGHASARPGNTQEVEKWLDSSRPYDARLRVWSNFRVLLESANAIEKVPAKLAGVALAAAGRMI